MRRITQLIASLVIAITGLTGCSRDESSAPRINEAPMLVTGEAFFRERIAVPQDAQFEALLEDVSQSDAPAKILGSARLVNAGQPPYQFEIPFQPSDIIPSHTYSLRARLSHQGQLLFVTDRAYPVITQGQPNAAKLLLVKISQNSAPSSGDAPAASLGELPATFVGELPCADCAAIHYQLDLFPDNVFFLRMNYRGKDAAPFDDLGRWTLAAAQQTLELRGGHTPVHFFVEADGRLRLLSQMGKKIDSELNYSLSRAEKFSPLEPNLELRGLYSYIADTGTFTECLTGLKLPVLTRGDNRALEAAYTSTPRQPGAALLVSLKGKIVQAPPQEGPGTVSSLLPEQFIEVLSSTSCAPPNITAELLNTYWKLTQLGDMQVEESETNREPHLMFQAENRLAGSDGCNQLAGEFKTAGDNLSFAKLASTKMACINGEQQSQAFLAALDQVSHYRVNGQSLTLLNDEAQELATFVAIANP